MAGKAPGRRFRGGGGGAGRGCGRWRDCGLGQRRRVPGGHMHAASRTRTAGWSTPLHPPPRLLPLLRPRGGLGPLWPGSQHTPHKTPVRRAWCVRSQNGVSRTSRQCMRTGCGGWGRACRSPRHPARSLCAQPGSCDACTSAPHSAPIAAAAGAQVRSSKLSHIAVCTGASPAPRCPPACLWQHKML